LALFIIGVVIFIPSLIVAIKGQKKKQEVKWFIREFRLLEILFYNMNNERKEKEY
jgi:hypothetical protein